MWALAVEDRVKSRDRAHLAMPARSETVDQQHNITAPAQLVAPAMVKRGQLVCVPAHHSAASGQSDHRREWSSSGRTKQTAFYLGCWLPRTIIVSRAEMHDFLRCCRGGQKTSPETDKKNGGSYCERIC